MKRFILLISFAFLIVLAVSVQGKDYKITQLNIVAEIMEDGSVVITETRQFEFEGSFSWVEWRLPVDGYTDLEVLAVYDGDVEIPIHRDGKEGTYNFSVRRNVATIRWNINAKDETRLFSHTYRLDGAISRSGNWAEFFWSFIGNRWEKPTENIHITLTVPGEGNLVAWPYSALNGERISISGNLVTYTAPRIRSNRQLRIRTMFDASRVANTVPSGLVFSPEQVEREFLEKRREAEERAAFRSKMEVYARYGSILVILLSLFFTWHMITTYRKREWPKVQPPSVIDRPPSDEKPAIVGWFLSHKVATVHQLSATIIDFANRGYFRIRQETKTSRFLKKESVSFILESTGKQPESTLNEWEMDLFGFLESRTANGGIPFDKLFEQNDKSYNWYQKWTQKVGKDGRSMGWFVNNKTAIIKLCVGQAVFIILSLIAMAYSFPYGLAAMFVASGGMISSFALMYRTEEGEEIYQRWKAYKLALSEGRASKEAEFTGRHLAYAITFGISGKRLNNLILSIEPTGSQLSWFLMMPGASFNPAAFSSSLTSVSTSLTASVSGGTGAVGGSAGGGGGGGGAG